MQAIEVFSFFKFKKFSILTIALTFVTVQLCYVYYKSQFYKADISILSESEQFNEDLLKMFHSNSISQAVAGEPVFVLANKVSSKQVYLTVTSESKEQLTSELQRLTKFIQDHQAYYFDQKKLKCGQHLSYLKDTIKKISEDPKFEDIEFMRNFLATRWSSCKIYFSGVVNVINYSALENRLIKPTTALDYMKLGMELDSEMLNKYPDHNSTIVRGAPVKVGVDKFDLLRILLNFVIFCISITTIWYLLSSQKGRKVD